jgi:hypothetical protein
MATFNNVNTELCSICYERTVEQTPCGHPVHIKCLNEWRCHKNHTGTTSYYHILENGRECVSCPMCRRRIWMYVDTLTHTPLSDTPHTTSTTSTTPMRNDDHNDPRSPEIILVMLYISLYMSLYSILCYMLNMI